MAVAMTSPLLLQAALNVEIAQIFPAKNLQGGTRFQSDRLRLDTVASKAT